MFISKLNLQNRALTSPNPIVRQRALDARAKNLARYFNVQISEDFGFVSDRLFGLKEYMARYAKKSRVSIDVVELLGDKGKPFLWVKVSKGGDMIGRKLPADLDRTYVNTLSGAKDVDGGDAQLAVIKNCYEEDWYRLFYRNISEMVAQVNPRSCRKK